MTTTWASECLISFLFFGVLFSLLLDLSAIAPTNQHLFQIIKYFQKWYSNGLMEINAIIKYIKCRFRMHIEWDYRVGSNQILCACLFRFLFCRMKMNVNCLLSSSIFTYHECVIGWCAHMCVTWTGACMCVCACVRFSCIKCMLKCDRGCKWSKSCKLC